MTRWAALALLAGCAHTLPLVPRPYPPPEPSVVLDALKQRSGKLRSLSVEARAEESGPGHARVRVKVSAWVEKPDRMRIEIEGPLGMGAATLVTADGRFSLLDARAGRLFTGEARGCNVARLVQVELDPRQAIAVLSGDVPLEEGAPSLAWDAHDGGRELLTLKLPDGEERVWLDGREHTWDPVKAERWRDGKLAWRVTHSGFADLNGRRMPAHTSVRDARRNAEIRLDWRDRELDPTLREEGFRLAPGPGVVAEAVGCEEPESSYSSASSSRRPSR